MVDFEPFFLLMAARQNVTTDCFYRTEMIKSVYNWQGQSLATHASFTDYAGNGKQILKIMEDKENKRVLKKCPDFHSTRIAGRQSEAPP